MKESKETVAPETAENGIPTEETPRKQSVKETIRAHLTATRIAYMALFTALAYAVTFLEFPLFPQANFLKLDFANVFFLIEGFIFGPVEAIVSVAIKELLCWGTKSTTFGIGELANFLMSSAYLLLPAIWYRFRKGKKWVVLYLALACVIQVGVSLLVNRFINFPLYGALFGFSGAEYFNELWPFVIFFNLIKGTVIGAVVFVIYKPLSRLITRTSERFRRKKGN